MFRDVPECSGMFRNVPCSGFYRRPKRMFIELLARMCNVLRLGSEVCNWLPASYLKKKEYSLHSAFCTQPVFYSQSAVCILHSLCILPLVRSLQSAVCSPQSAFYTDRFNFSFVVACRYESEGKLVVKSWKRELGRESLRKSSSVFPP